MAREADLLLPTHAGPELGVASTKAFTCQLAVLAALAAHLALKKGKLSAAEERDIVRHLIEAPAALNAAGATIRCRTIRSEEHTSELQSLMRISYAVFCLTKQNQTLHIRHKSSLSARTQLTAI